MEHKIDWEEVATLQPKGYCEVQDHEKQVVYHGPVESVKVDEDDNVTITFKWVAVMGLPGQPKFGKWEKAGDEHKTVSFPNLMVPFVIEETPQKGDRVRFGINIMYLDPQPNALSPDRVAGLESWTETAPAVPDTVPAPTVGS